MRKFTFCVTAALTALALIPASNARADVQKTVDVSIAKEKTTGSVKTDLLQPGAYTFSGKDATFSVKNDKTLVTEGVTLEKAAQLTIEWSIASPAVNDTVYTVTITTTSDKAAKDAYTAKIAIMSNKAGKYDDATLQALALETSTLQGTVNKITWDQFQEYAELGSVAAFEDAIDDIGGRIDNAVANYEVYFNTALGLHTDLEAVLADLTTTYNGAEDATKNASKKSYDDLKAGVAAFKNDAKTAYDNAEVTKASKATEEKALSDKAALLSESMTKLENAIISGSTNELSYANVIASIGIARDDYNTYANDLFVLLQLNEADDADIYNDLYVKALTEMSPSLLLINAVEEENQQKYDAEEANEATQLDFTGRLAEAIAPLADIYDSYETLVNTLRANYVAACNDIKGIQAYVKENIEDVYGKRSSIKDFYKDNLAGINSLIAALQEDVDDANKAHEIENGIDDPYCEGYDDAKTAIIDAVDALNLKVVATVSEYDYNEETKTAINNLQNSFITSDGKNGAKAAVAALVSDDKNYNAKDFYSVTESSIQASIEKVSVDAAKAYVLNDDVNNTKAKEFFLALDLSKIETAIINYQADAVAALASYNKVAADLTGFAAKMKTLTETATNTEVTVDGTLNDGVKTYADTIAILDATIAKIQSALDAALALTDAKHVAAINAIDTQADDINGALTALAANYAANEVDWTEAQLLAAKTRMLDDADRRIAELKLPASDYAAADYGLKTVDLNTKLNSYKTELSDLSDDVDAARSADASEAIALLADIQAALEELSKKVAALETEANAVKTAYAAERKAFSDLEAKYALYDAMLNGGTVGTKDYPGVAASYTGDRINFTDEIAAQNTAITALVGEVQASFTAETLVKDLEDVVKDGKVTKKGYTSRINAISDTITLLLGYAANETANDKANADFATALTAAGVEALITQAGTDIAAVATGDGLTYFNGELDKYEAEYTQIGTDRTNAYKAEVKDGNYTDTSKNMTAKFDGLKTRLDNLVAGIKGLKDLAKANEDAHKAQVKGSEETTALWNGVFAEVAGSYASSVHDSIIALLTQYKKDIVAYDAEVASAFKAGNSDKNSETIEGTLTDINNSILAIKNGWTELYAQAIAGDNQERKERFDASYSNLRTTYTESITLIEKMQKLSFADEVDLGTIAQELTSYAQLIRNLQDTVDLKYAETVAPALFDPEETYLDTVAKYMDEILDKTETYTTAVNGYAIADFEDEAVIAQDAVDLAVAEIQVVLGYSKDEAEALVESVQGEIDAAWDVEGEQDFAYIYDKTILPYFTKTLYSDLLAIQDAEAVKAWEAMSKANSKLANAEKHAIERFKDEDGNKGKYTKEYTEWIKILDASAQQWKLDKSFANYSVAYNLGYKEFEGDLDNNHTTIYWIAYNEDAAYYANNNLYKELQDTVLIVEADFNAAKDLVMALYVKNDLTADADNIEGHIDNLSESVENWYEDKVADDNYPLAMDAIAEINGLILGMYDKAMLKEKEALDVAILALNYDYDKATAADLEDKHIDTYLDSITVFSDANVAIYKDYTDEKATAAQTQAAFLALENRVGVAKSELVAIWNAAEINEIKAAYEAGIAEIIADYNALKAQFADCHDAVINLYSEDVEAIKAAADDAKARFDQMAADNTLPLYADNIDEDIQNIKDSYEGLDALIAALEDTYDLNDSKKDTFTKQNAAYQTKLDELSAMISGLKYRKNTGWVNTIKNQIKNNTNWINELYADVDLWAEDALPNDPTNNLIKAEAEYKHYNAEQTLVKELLANGSVPANIEKIIAANIYDDGVDVDLKNQINAVAAVAAKALDFVYTLDNQNAESEISKEIDGSNVKGGNRTTTLLNEYASIMAALDNINKQYEAINTEAAQDAKGDIGGDGKIDFEDVQGMLQIALSSDQSSDDIEVADLNGDGVVDIADIVMLVNVYVYGNKYGAAGAPYAGAPFRNVNVEETISLSNTENMVSVSFNNAYTYSAIQMDVTLPAGATIENFVMGERAQNFEIVTSQLANGAWRVIMFSANGKSIADKSGVLFNMAIESEAGKVLVDNVKVSRTFGLVKTLSSSTIDIPGTTAVLGIDADDADVDIFSTSGIKMNELGNGVNIIRTQSGDVKKVIVK